MKHFQYLVLNGEENVFKLICITRKQRSGHVVPRSAASSLWIMKLCVWQYVCKFIFYWKICQYQTENNDILWLWYCFNTHDICRTILMYDYELLCIIKISQCKTKTIMYCFIDIVKHVIFAELNFKMYNCANYYGVFLLNVLTLCNEKHRNLEWRGRNDKSNEILYT